MEHRRAGAALFNAGYYLAAHEPWEERWLEDDAGARDDCLQGLIQAAAATHKARTGNWTGAVGLAESGASYLAGCGHDRLREWTGRLAADPELGERERPPPVVVDGRRVTVEDLDFPAAALAAEGLAETRGEETVERAVALAREDHEGGVTSGPFVPLVRSYLSDDSPTLRERIDQHVQRRAHRESDVEGLFE